MILCCLSLSIGPPLETDKVIILVCHHFSLAHLHGQQMQWTHKLLVETFENSIQCFAVHRDSDRQGVKETAQQTAKSPEEGPARGGEEERREGETAEESEEEERG